VVGGGGMRSPTMLPDLTLTRRRFFEERKTLHAKPWNTSTHFFRNPNQRRKNENNMLSVVYIHLKQMLSNEKYASRMNQQICK
jgi:hypothetical protein